MNPIEVYGTDWCDDTHRTRNHLDALGMPYQYINIDEQPGAATWVKQQNDGKQKTPTVKLQGLVLSEPSDAELDAALRRQGLMA